MAAEEKFGNHLAFARLRLEEIMENTVDEDTGVTTFAYEQLGELVRRFEKAKDATADHLMELEKDFDCIKRWRAKCKGSI